MCKLPQVSDLGLVAMPDARLGERGCLFVTLNPGAKLSFNDMVAYLKKQQVAVQYFPEHLVILDEMPRTPSGKIQKFVLRQWASDLEYKGRQT